MLFNNKELAGCKKYSELRILEPSIGVGNFLPALIEKYSCVHNVIIDVVDIDSFSIEILKELVNKLEVPVNVHINYITDDFLLHKFDSHYDLIVGNPPYKKLTKEKNCLICIKLMLKTKILIIFSLSLLKRQ